MRIALVVALAFAVAGTAAGEQRTVVCPPTLANQLTSTRGAKQLIAVDAPRRSSTLGSLQLWRKTALCWRPAAGPWQAWLGERGDAEENRAGGGTGPARALGFAPATDGIRARPG